MTRERYNREQQEPPPLSTAEALMLAGLLASILLAVYRLFFA